MKAWLAFSLTLGYHGAAAGALTCEQLAGAAYTSQQLRDQGYSLQMVVAEVGKLEATGKFTAEELARIRGMTESAYRGERSPLEVLRDCKEKLKQ